MLPVSQFETLTRHRPRSKPPVYLQLSSLAGWLTLVVVSWGGPVQADVIHLKNGKKIRAESSWEEDDKIRYERNGNTYGFSKSLVLKVEKEDYRPSHRPKPSRPPSKSDGLGAFEQQLEFEKDDEDGRPPPIPLRDGKPDELLFLEIERDARQNARDLRKQVRYHDALIQMIQWHHSQNQQATTISYLKRYLEMDPDDLQAQLMLGLLYIKQGQYSRAESLLSQAQINNSQSPELHQLLGTAYYYQDKNSLASRTLKRSLQLRFNPAIHEMLRKIEGENQVENRFRETNSLHFVVRYEGTHQNRKLSRQILSSLEKSFRQMEDLMNFSPREPIAVVIYPEQVFQDVTRSPNWVGALNDGKIRIPIKGLEHVDAQVARILKHELVHSFVRLRSRGTCPVWLNEGLAQHLSGESTPGYFVPVFKLAVAEGRFPQLQELESSFLGMSAGAAGWAYSQSLVAAEFMRETYGLDKLMELVSRAGESATFEAVLQSVLRTDYGELQGAFERYIRALRS